MPADWEERMRLSRDRQQEIATRLTTAILEGERDRSVKLKDVDQWRRAYVQDLPKRDRSFPFPGASEICLPLIQTAVDGLRDRLSRVIFGVDPYFLVKGRDSRDQPLAAMLEKYLQWRCQFALNLRAVVDYANLLMCRDGTVWAIISYEERRGWAKQREQNVEQSVLTDDFGFPVINRDTGMPSTYPREVSSEVDVQYTTYRGPVLRFEEVENVGIYPAAAVSADEITGFYRRIRKRFVDWRRGEKQGRYSNVEALAQQSAGSEELRTREGERAGTQTVNPQEEDARIVSAYECIWRESRGEGPERWYVYTVATTPPTLLRAANYPYWHGRPYIVPMRIMPRSASLYGVSIPEVLMQLQEEINAVNRQYIDAGTLANAPTLLARRQAGFRANKFRAQVGQINHFDDPQSVQFLKWPGPDGTLPSILGMLDKYAQRVIGMSDLSMGAFPAGEVKATEVQAVMQESSIKFEQMLNRVQTGSGLIGSGEGLNEIALQVLALGYQYDLDSGVVERLFNGENPFAQVKMEDLLLGYDIIAKGSSSTTNKDLEKQQRLAFTNWVTSHPIFAPFIASDPVRAYRMLRWTAEPQDIKGLEDFIGTEEEAVQTAQQQQQQQQEQQQMMMEQAQGMRQDEMQRHQDEMGLKGAEIGLKAQDSQARQQADVMKGAIEMAKLGVKPNIGAGK